ncbi:hypothetical protein [Candidatus Solirubrobacter pratensis]|uniref:hypothetical protein n=1 Tax=Candidatus Solirubrobacter pratensis TaxID=1298857 RepID=UPI000423B4A0|nr:hypothetical protein [Candidatus Solirubrobacter pratensis]
MVAVRWRSAGRGEGRRGVRTYAEHDPVAAQQLAAVATAGIAAPSDNDVERVDALYDFLDDVLR